MKCYVIDLVCACVLYYIHVIEVSWVDIYVGVMKYLDKICDRACENQPSGRINCLIFSTLPFHNS